MLEQGYNLIKWVGILGNKASFIQNLIFFIVVFLIITVSGCEDDAINEAKPKLGQIEGLLKPADAATEIQLVQAGNIVATTYPDENGKYIFSNLEFGGYDIIVIAEGYHVASEVNTITLDKEVAIKNFQLVPLMASIRGIVIDSEGAFIENASITVSALGDEFTTQTDQFGVFSFNQLPPEVGLVLGIFADGKVELQVTVEPIEKGGTKDLQISLKEIEQKIGVGSQVGDLAPNFSLPDVDGKIVSLKDFASKQTVLLTFHRGKLWPVCLPQLVQLLQKNYNKISDLKAEVIAISHESAVENKKIHQQHKLEYFSLSDPTAKTIRDYKVLDFGRFPKVSFFIVDKQGIIRWRSTHSGANPDDLPKIDDLLKAIQLAQ